MNRRRITAIALAIALPLSLTGCNDGLSEMHWEPLWGVPGGGGGSAPAQPAPAQPGYSGQPLAPGASGMMQDPEAQNDDAIEVVATSKTHADNLCADQAARLSDSRTIVTCLGCRMRTATTGKFVCTVRTEHL